MSDREVLIVRLSAAIEEHDPDTLGDDPAEYEEWLLLYDARDAIRVMSAKTPDLTAIVEVACASAYEAQRRSTPSPGEWPTWSELPPMERHAIKQNALPYVTATITALREQGVIV